MSRCTTQIRYLSLALLTFFVVACESALAPPTADDAEHARRSPDAYAIGSIGVVDATLLPEPTRDPRQLRRVNALNSIALQSGPSQGFPVVLVRAGAGPGAVPGSPPVVDNFADALDRVAPGGTIRVFPGTYVVDAVEIAKPVTILAHSGRPLIVNQDAPFSFGVFAVADGVVRFQGLDFALVAGSRSSIIARFVYPDVVVENCTFDATAGVAGVEAGFNDTGAGRVLVRGSTFRAGATGTFAFGGGILEVRQSVLGEHTLSGVQYQSGSSGVVEDNDIGPCGTVGCVRVFASAVHVLGNRLTQTRTDVNPGTHHVVLATAFATVRVAHNEFHGCGTGSCLLAINGADVEVVDNRFTVFAGQGTRFGVAGSDGSAGTLGLPPPTMLVTDNVITGVGGTPGDFEGYAIEIAAIMAEHGAVVTAQRNTITNAQRGLQTWDNGTFVNSRDNVIDLVWWGMTIFNQSRVEARINDVTRAVEEIAVFDSDVSLSDLTCNWWASAGGPSNVSPGIAPALYTPWATAPVAGTSATSCTGGL